MAKLANAAGILEHRLPQNSLTLSIVKVYFKRIKKPAEILIDGILNTEGKVATREQYRVAFARNGISGPSIPDPPPG
jgi:hypothetical protein